jgi:large subunit ribosomal protein L30
MTEAKKPAAKKAAAPKAAAAPKKAAAPAKSGKKLKVTQVRSVAGRFDNQLATLKGLGLNKIRRSKVLEDTPSVRGMIEAVKHLVVVEDAA